MPHRMTVEGKSWKESSTDIAIAGVGWLGIGVAGVASFDVWTHDGAPHALLGLKCGLWLQWLCLHRQCEHSCGSAFDWCCHFCQRMHEQDESIPSGSSV